MLRVWQKGPLCAKLQIEERDSTTIQHDIEKKTQSKNKKNEKKSITKISKFQRFVLKTRNFLKSTNHKIFKMF